MEFINYAHRGASAYAPENTLAAFYMGWQMGANGIETDVQRTKDGVLVLFHDNELMRIAGRPEVIHDLTYAELLQIDFGLPTGERFKGERIPTLEEFLRHFDIPILAYLRNTQNYVNAAAGGLTVFDPPRSKHRRDEEQWQPLLQWLAD